MINKYKKLSNTIKASIWFVFCSMLQKGITFLTVPIFTRLMTSTEYGQFALFLSWQEIIMIFSTLNLNYQVFNNGMVKYSNDKNGYTTSMVGLAFISSIVSFIIISIFYGSWYKYTGIDYISVTLMFINMFSLVIIGLWTVRKRYEFEYKILTIITILMSLMNPIIGIILVKFSKYKVLFRIISVTITSMLFGIITLCFLLKKSKKIISIEYWKYALKIDLPLIPHYISMVVLHSSDRIMIGNLVNKSATALYSISYNVALVMQIILNSINASFIPWVYQKMKDKEYGSIKSKSNLLILVVAAITLIPMFFAPEAVLILGGKEYLEAVDIIPILSTSVFLIFLYSIFIIIEMYYEKSSYITFGSFMAAILNLSLNYIFIRIGGYKAAAYTTLVSYFLLSILHCIMYKKILKNKKIENTIFDIKFMFIISLLLVIISILMTFIYNCIIIRYLLLFISVIILLIYRKKITNKLKDIFKRRKIK